MKATLNTCTNAISRWQDSLPERSRKAISKLNLAPIDWVATGRTLYILPACAIGRNVVTDDRSFEVGGTWYPDGCYDPSQLGGGKTFIDATAEHRAAWHEANRRVHEYYHAQRVLARHCGLVTRTVNGEEVLAVSMGKDTYLVVSPVVTRCNDDLSASGAFDPTITRNNICVRNPIAEAAMDESPKYRAEGGLEKQASSTWVRAMGGKYTRYDAMPDAPWGDKKTNIE